MSKTKFCMLKVCSLICTVLIIVSAISEGYSAYATTEISRPKNVKVAFISTGVKIKWSKVKSAKGYYIYRKKSTSSKFTRIAKITKNTKLTYTDKKAQSGNYYIYAVKAYKGKNTSSYKKTSKKYYIKAPEISGLKNDYESVTVKWRKVKGVKGYCLYRKTGNGSWKKIATMKGDSKVKYIDKKVANGRKYTYSLKAYKSGKASVRGVSKQLKFKRTSIKLSLNKTKLNLHYGKSYNLVAALSIKDVSVKWKSDNSNIATVNSKGKVTAVSEGKTKITAYFVYNQKQYKNVCDITVTENEYSIGQTVNLDGKLTFKIESVKAHNSCVSASTSLGRDNLIIAYSYKNISCGQSLKIGSSNFTISDEQGVAGSFIDDCMHCISPDACSVGMSENKAVAVGVLSGKGNNCYLRLTVNVSDYGKVTAKFKLKIDRNDAEFLNDENALAVMGATVNAVKKKIKNQSTFKLISAVYNCNDSFKIGDKNITTSSCTLGYSYLSADGKAVTKYVKAWRSYIKHTHNDCENYFVKGGYLVVMQQNGMPLIFNGEIPTDSVIKAGSTFTVLDFAY